MTKASNYLGGCACGAVRFRALAEPLRTGLCHCLTCQKTHGAPFNHFVVFAREAVETSGEIMIWESSTDYQRAACAKCGARVFALSNTEIELASGAFDAPGAFTPEYESWTARRQTWLAPLDVPQFDANRIT